MLIMKAPEAVFILNAGFDTPTEPNHDTEARIRAGLEYAVRRDIGQVIMVGAEARQMSDFAQTEYSRHMLHIDPIQVEDMSRDTIGNAHYAKTRFMKPNEWQWVAIMAGDYQAQRAGYLFNRVTEDTRCLVRAVDTRYEEEFKQKLLRREKVLMTGARLLLAGVDASEDEKRVHRLHRYHPAYDDSVTQSFIKPLRHLLSPRV
jgi:hypothetical protein